MNIPLIFIWIYAAMVSMSFWEAYVEGRSAWDKRKLGWKLHLGNFIVIPAYHFYLFLVMWPLLLTLPFVVSGWDMRLFGVIVSAYCSGMVIEDFMWFVVSPVVKFREFHTTFTDYYPWIRIANKKVVPIGYVVGIIVATLSWFFVWR